jgi:hypothetical protein
MCVQRGHHLLACFGAITACEDCHYVFDPDGRPGPGLPGSGAPAGWTAFARMFLNPRLTWAGVSRPGGLGGSAGDRGAG